MSGIRELLADKPIAVTGALAATLNALVLLNVATLSGDQVAALNAVAAAWLGVLQALVVPKKLVAERVAVAEKIADERVEEAHSAGFDKAIAAVSSLPEKPVAKAAAKKR